MFTLPLVLIGLISTSFIYYLSKSQINNEYSKGKLTNQKTVVISNKTAEFVTKPFPKAFDVVLDTYRVYDWEPEQIEFVESVLNRIIPKLMSSDCDDIIKVRSKAFIKNMFYDETNVNDNTLEYLNNIRNPNVKIVFIKTDLPKGQLIFKRTGFTSDAIAIYLGEKRLKNIIETNTQESIKEIEEGILGVILLNYGHLAIGKEDNFADVVTKLVTV
jgi:hypothetical protein